MVLKMLNNIVVGFMFSSLYNKYITWYKEIGEFCLYAPKRNNNVGIRYGDRLLCGLQYTTDGYVMMIFPNDEKILLGVVDDI